MANNNIKRSLEQNSVQLMKAPAWACRDDGESSNARFINHEMELMKYATDHIVDFTLYDEVSDACSFYMNSCGRADVKPNIIGLCCVLRCTKSALYNVINGKTKSDPLVRDLLQQMLNFMEYQLNLSITDSKQNPVGSIFLLKNHHQYSDKSEYVVEGKNNGIEELTDKELKDKYLENVIDLDE